MIIDKHPVIFDNVSKNYRSGLFRERVPALCDLQFHVERGEVFGIIGANGAGKSSTLKILMGFIRADRGNVFLSGKSPESAAVRQKVGYLPENPCLYDNLSILDHLRFADRVSQGGGNFIRRAMELLELVQLEDVAQKAIRGFSKGMTQRAALALAFFHNPEILILDEPMSGLDPLGRHLVVDMVRNSNSRGNTILFCSHILTDVERMCNRIALLHKGRLLSIIAPEKLGHYSNEVNGTHETPLETFFLSQIGSATEPTLNS
jgi:ABC-2 type transport system ATP-binding protein